MTVPPRHAPASAQLDLLHRMVEDIAGETALEPLLTRILARACELIGAEDGTIGLYDSGRDLIRTAAVHRMPERELGAEMARGVGLAGAVLASGKPIIARYGDLPNTTLTELADNSVIGMPIVWRGAFIGFFGIGARPPRTFDMHDADLLDLFARHAAIAITNARQHEQAQRRTARFELIARVASGLSTGLDLDTMLQNAADAVHEVLDYPNVDIPLLDPKDPDTLIVKLRGGAYKRIIHGEDRIPIAHGIMGAAIRERRAQLVNNVAADPRYVTPPGVVPPRAELAVPIVLGDQALGVVNVEGDEPFDDLDVVSLEIIADYLAVAINHARLVAGARETAVLSERQRLARELHDNVTQILSSISLLTQTLVSAWRRDPSEGERRVTRLQELAQRAFAEMRALLRELQPVEHAKEEVSKSSRAVLGVEQLRAHALPGALTRLLAAMVPEHLELKLEFGSYRTQHVEVEQALFRICQEAVSNVIRHAQAKRLWVSAAVHDAEVVLSVLDDGRGIDGARPGGLGLTSMQARAQALGGSVRIAPRSPSGTSVEARAPRRDRDATPPREPRHGSSRARTRPDLR
jgi:nitrate/nitrite-specific signal transduction histidine kinase